jgi:hypothetical protein
MALPPLPEFCRCCEPPVSPIAGIYNRPGLSKIFYRSGSFAQLRQAMLLDIVRHPELSALTTRESYAVTLIELFAAMGDVLTFYNERIANELFLRTAIERDSVLRMLRLIGYRLRPGLAAEAWLAFTLDSGAATFIRKGLKVMSVPGQDEKPLFFETIEELHADWRLNALPVFVPPLPFNAFHQGRMKAPLTGRPDRLNEGDALVFFTLLGVEEKTVGALQQQRDGEHLAFAPPIQSAGLWPEVTGAAKVRRQIGFFGNAAVETYREYLTDPTIPPQNRWVTRTAGTSPYNVNFAAGATSYPLERKFDDLKPGARFLVDRGAGAGAMPRMVSASVVSTESKPASLGQLEDTVTHATLGRTVYGRQAALVGADGTLEVMARGGVRSAMVLDLSAPRPDWLDLGTVPVSAVPAAVSPVPGQTLVFVRDNLAGLRLNTRNGASWLGWSSLGGILTTAPAAASDTPGRVFVFAGGLAAAGAPGNLGLWVRVLTPAFLDVWRPLHGLLTSRPAPVSWGVGHMDVFARGPDRGLWVRSWNGAAVDDSGWDVWEALKGTLASEPAAAATGPSNIDVVALDDDGGLIHRRYTGGAWQDWLDLGGEAVGEPALVATGPDRVEAYVRGSDDQLWTRARNGDTWGAWMALGGVLASSPSVAHGAGTTLVAVEGHDGRLHVRQNTGAGWGAWSTPGGGLGAIADRRETRIYELVSPEIRFREYALGNKVSTGRVAVRMVDAPGLASIDKDRRIVLEDATQKHLASVTATRPLSSEFGGPADHLLVEFTPAPGQPLTDPVLKGNLANASHGETQGAKNPDSGRISEVLGNGAAAVPFQSFKLAKSPLTYLSSGASLSGVAELEVRVSNEKWTEVPSLFGRKPNERVYTARQNDAGETIITFGDGKTGARVKSGASNVEASYRAGSGLAGRLEAGQLSIPLERPVGLREVTNPFGAEGGADQETRDKAREAGPASVRTFGRAVSLQDFEWLALSSPLVAKASARWIWRGLEKAVHLTVAGELGESFTAEGLKDLRRSLDDARDPNRTLLLADYCPVPVQATAQVLRDPAYTKDDVERWARAALEASFDFAAGELGQPVHASNVLAHLQAVTGVAAVGLEVFHFLNFADLSAAELGLRLATSEPVQEHLLVQQARPKPSDPGDIDAYVLACFPDGKVPKVLPAELAVVKDPSADLTVHVVEAL